MAGPASSLQWAGQEHWEESRNTSRVPPRCRQKGFLQQGWSLFKLLGIPGPTKSSCQTKVCIPRKCSKSSCLSSRAVALLRTSFCSVENKISPICSSWILLRKRPHCNTAPQDTAGCPAHLCWDIWEHLSSSFSWKTWLWKATPSCPLPFHLVPSSPPCLWGISLQTTSNQSNCRRWLVDDLSWSLLMFPLGLPRTESKQQPDPREKLQTTLPVLERGK